MHIINIGYNHYHNADFSVHRPQGSGDYLFVLLKSPAVFTLGGGDFTAEADSVILFGRGTPQCYRACGAHFLNDWFHFDLDGEEINFFRELDIPFDTILPVKNTNDLSLMIKNMCCEIYSSNTYRADTAELYMKLLFFKLSEKIHSDESGGTDPHYDKLAILRSKIYSMPQHEWTVEKLAASLTLSKSRFQHLYKEIFGISVMSDVIQSRTEHSKYLLSSTDLPVAKIAEMCGYNSGTHFMRQFKDIMGMTPSEYRARFKAPRG